MGIRYRRIASKVLLVICIFNGVLAVAFGVIMMAFPNGIMGMDGLIPWIQKFPFPSFFTENLFWSGIALGLVNGLPNLITLSYYQHKNKFYSRSIICGTLLICWTVFECLYFPNIISVIYAFIGVIQVFLAIFCFENKRGLRSSDQAKLKK